MPTDDTTDVVPVIDLTAARTGDPAARAETAAALDAACRTTGFFAIVGHGIDDEVIDGIVSASAAFFDLPFEDKAKLAPPSPEVFRGFLGMDTTALAATLGDESPPDLSESFNVSRFDTPESRTAAGMPADREAFFFPNLWPEEPAELRPAYERYYAAMEDLVLDLVRLLSLGLGLDEHHLDPFFEQHTGLLLVNHYPEVERPPLPGQLRRGAHTDYGALTVLWAGPEPGLEVEVGGEWTAVRPPVGGFVVNLGDLMARWTNDRWRSTLHRVVVPDDSGERGRRMSIPFFSQPNYTATIETLPTTLADDGTTPYEPVTAGEWILAKSMAMLDD